MRAGRRCAYVSRRGTGRVDVPRRAGRLNEVLTGRPLAVCVAAPSGPKAGVVTRRPDADALRSHAESREAVLPGGIRHGQAALDPVGSGSSNGMIGK